MNRPSLASLPVLALALALAGSLTLPPIGPASAAPVPAPTPANAVAATGVPQAAEALLGLADAAAQAPGPAEALQAAGALPAAPGPAERTRSPDLAAALARLGSPVAPDDPFLAALDPATQAALVPALDAVADAAQQVDAAFAGLTAAERTRLLDGVLSLGLPGSESLEDQQREADLEALAERVDVDAIRAAAAGILSAAEGFLAAAPPAPASTTQSAASGAAVPAGAAASGVCAPGGFSVVAPGGLVEVGFTGSNSYLTERVLIVELGGDDCYENYPAAYGPGSNLALPVSVIVDAGGDDVYYTGAAHPNGPPGTAWSGGVGIGGIGLIADRWGNDQYVAVLNNEPSNCQGYGGSSTWQRLYAQGVGILGVGAIADLGGDDRYSATNFNNLPDAQCHWGRVYTYGQAVGARLGVGALVDDTGNDRYWSDSWAEGKFDNNAHTHAQAAASLRGVAALLDKEGNDDYHAQADSRIGAAIPYVHKGTFAYVFAQASLYGTNEPRNEAVTVRPPCVDVLPQTVALCKTIGRQQVTVGVDPCSALAAQSPIAQLLAQAGQPIPGVAVPAGAPCDHPAYALLVDIQGGDNYYARAGSSDNGLGCDWGSWAGASAQGAAPTKGLAALVDAAVDTRNDFTVLADAQGQGCSTLGVRSYTGAQGFGGAFMWDYWDRPPFDPPLLTDLAAGLLVRGGACGLDLNLAFPLALAVDSNDPCPLAFADDAYTADATSTNGAPQVAWSETVAQGAGNGHLTANDVPGGPYDGLGLGGHVDLFGDDRFVATSHALTPAPPGAPGQTPKTVAQGASTSAMGVLLNVGDVDAYDANAFFGPGPGVPVPVVPLWTLPWIVAQADSTIDTAVSVSVCTPVGCSANTIFLGIGVLVDVWGGPWDTYTQAVPSWCASNGAFPLLPYVWGNVLPPVCVHNPPGGPPPAPGSQGFILGIDW